MTESIVPKVPPHSLEAEQGVLGGLLLDNAAFDNCMPLSAESFFIHRHQLIWAAIAEAVRQNLPADVITVSQALSGEEFGGMAYVNSLAQSTPSAANARRYAQIVRDMAAERALIAAAGDAGVVAWGEGTLAEKLDRIGLRFHDLQRQQIRKIPRSLSDVAIARTALYEAIEAGTQVKGYPGSIPRLNALLNGGFRAGGLYILAARPSIGKSSFAQALGLHMAKQGHSGLFLSQEMCDGEIADRGVSNVGRVSYSDLLNGTLTPDGWGRVTDALEELGRLPFHVDDQASLTLLDIRAKAMQVKPKFLILDYLQLCASTRKDKNRNSEIEEISRGLKTLAKDLDMAVIALSQLNRNVENRQIKRPTLADLRDSGAIEQDADVVMFLWPVREFENEGRRILGLGVDKNRQGRLGDIALDFYGDHQRWAESTADIRPEPAAPTKRFE